MLNFVYLGKYSAFDEADHAHMDDDELYCNDASADEALQKLHPSEAILTHLRIIIMADYYGIHDLIEYANAKITRVLDRAYRMNQDVRYHPWSFNGLLDVARVLFEEAPSAMQSAQSSFEVVIDREIEAIVSNAELMEEASGIPQFVMALMRPLQGELTLKSGQIAVHVRENKNLLKTQARWRNKAKKHEAEVAALTQERDSLNGLVARSDHDIKALNAEVRKLKRYIDSFQAREVEVQYGLNFG